MLGDQLRSFDHVIHRLRVALSKRFGIVRWSSGAVHRRMQAKAALEERAETDKKSQYDCRKNGN